MACSFVSRTARGAAWSYVAFILARVIALGTTVALARLLEPQQIGLMAAALLLLRYLDGLQDLGLSQALIRTQSEPERAARTALSLMFATASISGASLFWFADDVASWMGSRDLAPLFRLLSSVFFFSMAANLFSAWMQRNGRFRERVWPETFRATVKGSVSVALAAFGYGAWGLAAGYALGHVAAAAAYFLRASYPLRLGYDARTACGLLAFGAPLALVSLAASLSNTLDQLVVSKYLGPVDLGFYSVAAFAPDLVVISLCTVVGQAAFPEFSRRQERPLFLKNCYLQTLRYSALLTCPAALGLAVISPEFVLVVYGEKWGPSAAVMAVLAINALIIALAFSAGDLLKALGKSWWLAVLAAANIVVSAPVLILSSSYGIVGVAIAQTATNALTALAALLLVRAKLGVTLREFAGTVGPAVIGAFGMAAVTSAIATTTRSGPPGATLVLSIALGALLYAVLIWTLKPNLTRRYVQAWASWGGRS